MAKAGRTISVGCLTLLLAALATGVQAAPVDFNREIRPILANHCLKCHGPDAGERKGGLRLDLREAAIAAADSGEKAIVPGKADASELIKRINSADADYHMPPAEEKKPLSEEQKKLLARWIAEGADYQVHWAFVAPLPQAIPDVKNAAWTRNAIDRFLLARLEREGLSPSAETSRETLVRRLTLDLTGFPPTLAEIDAFLADDRPDAYERLVDRLVASPHFGERLAVDWLDAARFADTHGYHIDAGRDMTRWREYVIDSFNRNTPYDRFTIEQLAGDLLPSTGDAAADLRQKLASGFNRNHMINFEGGAIPEEYLNAYIIDRVNTTGTVFLGLTVACTQCHDHKYDPISQRDYYQFYAFFNNVPEQGLDGRKGNASPTIKVASLAQEQELATIAAEIAAAEKRLKESDSQIDAEQVAWEKTALAKQAERWLPLTALSAVSRGGATLTPQEDKSVLVSGKNPATDVYELTIGATKDVNYATALRLEVLPHDSLAGKGPGRSVNGNLVLTEVVAEIVPAAKDARPQPVKLKAASADFSQKDFPAELAIDDKPATGWAIHPEMGKPHAAVFEFASPLELADGAKLRVVLKFESQFGQHQPGLFRLSATRTTNPHATGAIPDAVAAALAIPAAERTAEQSAAIRKHYREHVSPTLRLLNADLAALKMKQATLDSQIPTSMVMQEQPQPRDTFVLLRGAYDKKGDKVSAAVPSFLPPLAEGLPNNRLGLARWLVDERHPLTARVTVNRYWQLVFGTGLVKTAEDFGTQGELPSHSELLDWLAVEFRGQKTEDRGQWDVKRLLRRLVSSAAYRQSSAVTPALVAKDPENRLLARGPRFRLQAEFIRDQALFVSGLYDGRLGGKSVSPYQPTGLWEELMSRADGDNWTAQKYSQDHGADLYRRTMYTFWKRTCPPPSLATLDAPDRETCTVRRSRTNTPLQALVLMNDPTYVEGARKFAERILREGGKTSDDKLTFAFRTVLGRLPSDAELAVLRRVLDRQRAEFAAVPDAANHLLTVGESSADKLLDQVELAAWTMVASAILNTDEAVTKG